MGRTRKVPAITYQDFVIVGVQIGEQDQHRFCAPIIHIIISITTTTTIFNQFSPFYNMSQLNFQTIIRQQQEQLVVI